MDIYLSFNNNEDVLRLPILPSAFEVQGNNLNSVIHINNIGDINLIGKMGLSMISLESFFPAQDYAFSKYNTHPRPYECVELINKWRKSGRPIRLIITGTSINIACAIESFNYGEQDGTRDVYFKITLKEYKFIKSSKPEVIKTPSGQAVKVPSTKRETKPIPSTYKVQKGDNMYTVAKKTTGSMSNANAIAKTNKVDQYKGMDLVKGTVVLI